jgi:DNA-directed RNA polymerase specialized sigma24 family protein
VQKNAIRVWNVSPVAAVAQPSHRQPSRAATTAHLVSIPNCDETPAQLDGQEAAPVEGHLDRDSWQRLLAFLELSEPAAAGGAYEAVRKKLLRFFRAKGAVSCEDLADATFDRVARKLQHEHLGEVRNPTGYALGVARLIWLESVKREVSCRNRLDHHEATRDQEARGPELERHLATLERCLVELGPDERALLIGYYDGQGRTRIEKREALVQRLGINSGLLRTRVHRLRAQLEVKVRAMLDVTEEQLG